MFKESPSLTREQKALILGFMAGSRGQFGEGRVGREGEREGGGWEKEGGGREGKKGWEGEGREGR